MASTTTPRRWVRRTTNTGRFYIINAPYIFTTVWAVVKGWLDPVTTEKIQIIGSNSVAELGKQIPLENLPSLVGGKCECPGGCAMSDAGPWKTPEGEEIIKKVQEQKAQLKREYNQEGSGSVEAPNTAPGLPDGAGEHGAAAGGVAAGGVAAGAAAGAASAPEASGDSSEKKQLEKETEQPETVIPASGAAGAEAPASATEAPAPTAEGLAPPLAHTADLAVPVQDSEALQLQSPSNGELAPPITQS